MYKILEALNHLVLVVVFGYDHSLVIVKGVNGVDH
jgi:hypothetical protein